MSIPLYENKEYDGRYNELLHESDSITTDTNNTFDFELLVDEVNAIKNAAQRAITEYTVVPINVDVIESNKKKISIQVSDLQRTSQVLECKESSSEPECEIISNVKENKPKFNRSTRRSLSECSEEVQPVRGILKWPQGWSRRTFSESCCDQLDSLPEDKNLDILESSCDIFHDLFWEEDQTIIKSVRFNERVVKIAFRSNSSILGQKIKNKRRSARRNSKSKGSNRNMANGNIKQKEQKVEQIQMQNLIDTIDLMKIVATETEIKTSESDETNVRMRQDSGYDSEETCIKSLNDDSGDIIEHNLAAGGDHGWLPVKFRNRKNRMAMRMIDGICDDKLNLTPLTDDMPHT